MQKIEGGVTAPKGFQANGLHCGIRRNLEKKDLMLIAADVPCAAAAVYTKNLVKGAPLIVTQQHLVDSRARAIVCNSGIANTCDADGEDNALAMCRIVAQHLDIAPQDVLVASTGIIGQPLPMEPIQTHMGTLVQGLTPDPEGGRKAAEAIMTTDTVPKEIALQFELRGQMIRIGGIAKGAGMIQPNMATMLSFITTDVQIEPVLLQEALKTAVQNSFNMLSIDSDTSTNDMVCILASGQAGNPCLMVQDADYALFTAQLTALCLELTRLLAKDGEGATKLLEVAVSGAENEEAARVIAKSVVNSPLVKTAIFGSDANWGRVICAIGYAGIPVRVEAIQIAFASKAGEIIVCQAGKGLSFSEETAKAILLEPEVQIRIQLGDGTGSALAVGCDLSYEYVRINGDYRS